MTKRKGNPFLHHAEASEMRRSLAWRQHWCQSSMLTYLLVFLCGYSCPPISETCFICQSNPPCYQKATPWTVTGCEVSVLPKGQTPEGGQAWRSWGRGALYQDPGPPVNRHRLEPTEAGPAQRQVVWKHRVDSLNLSWWTEELAGVRWKSRWGLYNRPPSHGAGCCSEHLILLLHTWRVTKTTWKPGGPHVHKDPGTLIWKANLLKMAIKLSLLIGKKGLITTES